MVGRRSALRCACSMSFRSRLTLFFVLIVVVPMVSAAVVLFRLISDNENAKSQARLQARAEVAAGFVDDAHRDAGRVAVTIAGDHRLADALRSGNRARIRAAADAARLRAGAARVAIVRDGTVVPDVGNPDAVFPVIRQLVDQSRPDVGRLEVSTQPARPYAGQVSRITKAPVIVYRAGQAVASTLRGAQPSAVPPGEGEVNVAGTNYQTSSFPQDDFLGRRSRVALLSPKAAQASSIRRSRMLAAGVLLGFFILAFTFAFLVSRTLQAQIESLLQAARRLGSGDFSARVPTRGRDEFAALGEEFNKMSDQLEARLADLRQERSRLQEALRRIGETFGSSLDREKLLEIALVTTLDGIDADGGRGSLRRDDGTFAPVTTAGRLLGLEGAMHAAEAGAIDTGRPSEVAVDDVRALAHPISGAEGVDGVPA